MEEKTIKKISIINLIISLIIMVAGILQIFYQGELVHFRRLRAVLGFFIILPLLFVSLVLSIFVFNHYLNKKNKKLKYFYFSIPTVIIYVYLLISFSIKLIGFFIENPNSD
jgi:hypothetical protein